tara:strand:- start:173 stop:601 length:429 start_codon:yes stop_codon:yes gene_type:complete
LENDEMSEESTDRLVSVFIKVRDKKAELTSEFKEAEGALNDKLDVLRAALSDKIKANIEETGEESMQTSHGTVFRTVKNRYWTSDWEAMSKFILENECVDLLEKRIQQTNMRQFLVECPDLLPPALNVDSEYVINVRRKKKK